jgi:cytochrome c oxidase cbb3-type subunit 3
MCRGRVVTARCALLALCALGALLAGCQREQRRFSEPAPSAAAAGGVSPGAVTPGGPEAVVVGSAAESTGSNPYEGNAWAVAEGKQLYQKYNCVGCHANGGGGMGPALMDARWEYGSTPGQVHSSIAEGRPNGMPAFGGKIPDQQIWKLAAYVRSMSGLLRKDVSPSRDDHMAVRPAEQAMPRQDPTGVPPR